VENRCLHKNVVQIIETKYHCERGWNGKNFNGCEFKHMITYLKCEDCGEILLDETERKGGEKDDRITKSQS